MTTETKPSRIENDQGEVATICPSFQAAKAKARWMSRMAQKAMIAVDGASGECVRYYCGKQTAKT